MLVLTAALGKSTLPHLSISAEHPPEHPPERQAMLGSDLL